MIRTNLADEKESSSGNKAGKIAIIIVVTIISLVLLIIEIYFTIRHFLLSRAVYARVQVQPDFGRGNLQPTNNKIYSTSLRHKMTEIQLANYDLEIGSVA